MARMTGGRYMAEIFKGYGVTHAFLVPVIARRAMVEMGELGITRVITHGEKAAAYMADGYARASNRVGVCMAQSVGAANLAAGLQDAYLGLSPVIAITGHRPPMHMYRNSYQEIDHIQPFSAVTKYSAMVDDVEQLPYLLRQAFREATSGATAPVHLDLQGSSGDVIADAEADLELIIEADFLQRPSFRPEPEPAKVREAAQLLATAQRPVIVAGGGVTSSGAQPEIVELAEMLSIPIATSLNAKGAVPEDHRLAVGVVGSYSRRPANQVVSEADMVVFVGSHTGSQVTLDWTIPAMGTPVIQIDIDPSELGRNYSTAAALQGDAKASVRRLIEASEPTTDRGTWVDRTRQLVQDWKDEVAPLAYSDDVPIRPERLCTELTNSLPSDAILTVDTGHAGIWTGSMVDLKHPDQGYLRAAGSLGWGLPAALGAKCGAPHRPVICWTGDGGFWYHIGELETAARYNINAVILVNDNGALNQNKRGDDRAYQGRSGDPSELYGFTDLDLSKVAQSMGCFGIRVDRPGDIQSAIEQALASNRPAIIDVKTDVEVSAPPPWSP